MAFNTLPSSLIQVGKALVKQIFQLIKDNLDNHETRIQSVEAIGNKIIVFNFPIINAVSANSATALESWRSPAGFTLTDAKVVIYEKGALTGVLEIDIRKASNTDESSAVSVFTTLPSITYASASSFDESSNAAFDLSNKVVLEGDYLFFDVTSFPGGGVIGQFNIYLIGES